MNENRMDGSYKGRYGAVYFSRAYENCWAYVGARLRGMRACL